MRFLSKHQGALDQWSLTTSELNTFVQSAPQFPVLCLRGQHDFVTEDELHCSGGMGLKFAVVGMKMRNIAKNVSISRLAKEMKIGYTSVGWYFSSTDASAQILVDPI